MSNLTGRERELLTKISAKEPAYYAGLLALHIARTEPQREVDTIVNHVEGIFIDLDAFLDEFSDDDFEDDLDPNNGVEG